MRSIALIAYSNNIYLEYIFKTLIQKGVSLSYFIVCGCNKFDLANTICFIDNNFSLETINKIEYNPLNSGFKKICQENSIPYFCVDNQNSFTVNRILNQYPIDVLFITDGFIQSDAIYLPSLFTIDCQISLSSFYKGDKLINISEVSFRSAQLNSKLGSILVKRTYNINSSENIKQEAQIKCIDLGAEVLNNIQHNKIPREL